MPETDSLSKFDFNKVSKPGKFLKFEAGKPVTIRILTKDPILSEASFGDNDPTVRLNFVVWNFTQECAQILGCSMTMAKTFQRIGNDEDFGNNLQKCDIKISPEGEKLERVYDINVVRHSGNEKELTKEMIDEAAAIDLPKEVKDSKGRLSAWEPPKKSSAQAREPENFAPDKLDVIIEDIPEGPINLDDIPF